MKRGHIIFYLCLILGWISCSYGEGEHYHAEGVTISSSIKLVDSKLDSIGCTYLFRTTDTNWVQIERHAKGVLDDCNMPLRVVAYYCSIEHSPRVENLHSLNSEQGSPFDFMIASYYFDPEMEKFLFIK